MRRTIPALTSLRFFSALWVFVFHLRLWHGPVSVPALDKLLMAGPVGMGFFFVLSGFILAYACADGDPLTDLRGYAVRRFSRIYPIYLVTLVAGWLLNGFAGELGERAVRSGVAHAVADLTLTNAWFPQLFAGGHGRDGTWSLSAEVFFYAVFPFVLFHARRASLRALRLGAIWCVGLTLFFGLLGKYIQPMDSGMQSILFYSLPIYRLPEFMAGVLMGVYALRPEATIPSGRAAAAAVVAMFAWFAIAGKSIPIVAHGVVAVPCFLLVFLYFSRNAESRAARFFSLPVLVFLGEASYALYLVQLVTIPWCRAHVPDYGAACGMLPCALGTLVAACLAHVLIERPLRRVITTVWNQKRALP